MSGANVPKLLVFEYPGLKESDPVFVSGACGAVAGGLLSIHFYTEYQQLVDRSDHPIRPNRCREPEHGDGARSTDAAHGGRTRQRACYTARREQPAHDERQSAGDCRLDGRAPQRDGAHGVSRVPTTATATVTTISFALATNADISNAADDDSLKNKGALGTNVDVAAMAVTTDTTLADHDLAVAITNAEKSLTIDLEEVDARSEAKAEVDSLRALCENTAAVDRAVSVLRCCPDEAFRHRGLFNAARTDEDENRVGLGRRQWTNDHAICREFGRGRVCV